MPLPVAGGILSALATAGGASAAQGLARALPTKSSIANRKRINTLEDRARSGQLGLTGAQKSQLDRQLNDPVRRATTQLLNRQSALQAASGQTSAADISRARRDASSTLAEGAQRAAGAVADADAQEARRQRQELEDRRAAFSARQSDITGGILGAINSAAGVVGQAAGDVPETLRVANAFGGQVRDFAGLRQTLTEEGFDPDDIAFLERLERAKPGAIARLLEA